MTYQEKLEQEDRDALHQRFAINEYLDCVKDRQVNPDSYAGQLEKYLLDITETRLGEEINSFTRCHCCKEIFSYTDREVINVNKKGLTIVNVCPTCYMDVVVKINKQFGVEL